MVLGATGETGVAIVAELVKRGIDTVAFGRTLSKLERLKKDLNGPVNLTLITGDVFNSDDVYEASKGADVIFHSASIPYNEMKSKLLPMGESVMMAANRLGVKVVAVDGIYPYGRRTTLEPIDEEYPKNPHTVKGKTKLEFEKMFFSRRWNQVQGLIVRLPDYYGPSATDSSYLCSTLQDIAAGKPTIFIGNMKVSCEFVYLPDAAKMIVELASRKEAYGQNWNIPGSGLISGRALVKLAQEASGTNKAIFPLGKASLSLIALFSPVIKEVVEMLYLTKDPLVLSGKKYERLVGPVPATSFEEGMKATIGAIKNRQSEKS
ncbi:NAD-dependent epimerase/dehydratase family protein [Paenibacillus sp. V4I9]|uniref:NAD-dependent epimerase/dehydratase family protein n=1 Tax=Paenibacillus sp. V4I9 TaxID=3042308 RepID=UPI0027D86D9F|nr:NAD-dependent epimerase/dehydratase family protein [Paenibacillus sp. V4I9]